MNRPIQIKPGKLADHPEFQELMSGMRSAQDHHAARLQGAVVEFLGTLREKAGSGWNPDVESAFKSDFEVLQARINRADSDWARLREWLTSEMNDVAVCRNPTEVYQEMARAEVAVAAAEERLEGMLKNTAVSLASLMRFRLRLNELQAYLKGLHFQAGKTQSLLDDWKLDPDL